MTFSDHFRVEGNALGPQRWMQLRKVNGAQSVGVSRKYDPTDGLAKNDSLQSVQVSWANDTPTKQWVYGMVTQAGQRVALQARSRGYISTAHGAKIATVPGTLDMTEVSRHGVGANTGVGGLLAVGTGFAVAEARENSTTIYLTPQHVGWYLLNPGETFTGRVETRFISEFWESTTVDGGSTGTESAIYAGDLRLDLFACPTVADPKPRLQPVLVGGAANVKTDKRIDLGVSDTLLLLNKPSGLQVGDILVALIVNNTGSSSEISPVQAGWTLAQSRNDDADGGYLDVHMKLYMRTVTDPTTVPAQYTFNNGFLAEGIGVLFALRNTVTFDGSDGGSGWFISTDLSRWKLVETQIAPSISRGGQMLIAFSYLTHETALAPLHQAVPDGMTALVEVPGTAGTLAVATLDNPPNPTGERKFTPDHIPAYYTGHSIAASLLVPGIAQL